MFRTQNWSHSAVTHAVTSPTPAFLQPCLSVCLSACPSPQLQYIPTDLFTPIVSIRGGVRRICLTSHSYDFNDETIQISSRTSSELLQSHDEFYNFAFGVVVAGEGGNHAWQTSSFFIGQIQKLCVFHPFIILIKSVTVAVILSNYAVL